MLIFGTQVKKKNWKDLPSFKKKEFKTKRMINLHETHFGITDSTLPQDHSLQLMTLWHSSHHNPLWMELSSILDTKELLVPTRIIRQVWMALLLIKTKRCWLTTSKILSIPVITDVYAIEYTGIVIKTDLNLRTSCCSDEGFSF